MWREGGQRKQNAFRREIKGSIGLSLSNQRGYRTSSQKPILAAMKRRHLHLPSSVPFRSDWIHLLERNL
jgi:hypothetical protein